MTRVIGLAVFATLAGAGLFSLLMATPASAQGALMGNSPWQFSAGASRASIAALIESKQSSSTSTGAAGAGGGEGNYCGGSGGEASAAANYTCIIIGESATASVGWTQMSAGNQQANAESTTGGSTSGAVQAGEGSGESLSQILEDMSSNR